MKGGVIICIFSIFSGSSKKKKAAVFIDYEHWYISLDKSYHIKPNIKDFSEEINKEYDVTEMIFFGDFSNPSLNSEMHKIRAFTNKIVETNNGGGFYKKDFTDFIMLDHIYRTAYTEKDIDTYIIFTGDGHFSSVVLFLKQTCKKHVVIYGVKNAFSGQLKQTADEAREIPTETDKLLPYERMILSNLYTLSREYENPRASFSKTVTTVCEKFDADELNVRRALETLINEGYVIQYDAQIGAKNVRLIKPDFDKTEKAGIYKKGSTVNKTEN